jgi:hypothetical protein
MGLSALSLVARLANDDTCVTARIKQPSVYGLFWVSAPSSSPAPATSAPGQACARNPVFMGFFCECVMTTWAEVGRKRIQ